MELGRFSVSLAVKDIKASFDFYTKLGFTPFPGAGSLEAKWIVLVNGTTNVGLFEGMFENNLMTFNPQDARGILASLRQDGIEVSSSNADEKPSGPCHFMIQDPDGNTILVDQHNE